MNSDWRINARFWSKVEVGASWECWLWTGATTHPSEASGMAHWRNGLASAFGERYAHRIAVVLSTGAAIPAGHVAMHLCDNSLCCNPGHLRVGTRQENVTDMWEKGRAAAQANGKTLRELISMSLTELGGQGTVRQLANHIGASVPSIRRRLNETPAFVLTGRVEGERGTANVWGIK